MGNRCEPKGPPNKTPRRIAELIWEIFQQNLLWVKERIAVTLWGLGVFVAASTVRNILRRPRPRGWSQQAQGLGKASPDRGPLPNHVWSVDRTRVWRWRVWPSWVLVPVDHFSRSMTAVSALGKPNAGWVVGALEQAFLQHRPPKHIITDREGVFVSDVFRDLLSQWNVKQRFGAVGKQGSIAVTERAILTLTQEWLKRVPVIRGLDHLEVLLRDFSDYYNQWRGHTTAGGATPFLIYRGGAWDRPNRSAKTISGPIAQ